MDLAPFQFEMLICGGHLLSVVDILGDAVRPDPARWCNLGIRNPGKMGLKPARELEFRELLRAKQLSGGGIIAGGS